MTTPRERPAEHTGRPLRTGLIGLGVISRFYAAAFDSVPGTELAAVCDRRPEALAAFRGPAARYSGHQEMIAAQNLDAVVVNIPNDAHAAVCRDALLSGLAVCVEKPLATRARDGRELVRLAHESGVTLFTSFHRRYNTNVTSLRARIPAATRVRSMTVRYLERIEEHAGEDRWYLDAERCGGGCVADNGPNAFDLVRQFLGDGVRLDGARVSRDAAGVDRQADIGLRADSGARARVHLDWSYPGERKDIEVQLTDGTVLRADMLAGYDGFKTSLWHEYAGVLAGFAHAVAGGEDHGSPGLAALELVEDVYRREGTGPRQGPVAVPPDVSAGGAA